MRHGNVMSVDDVGGAVLVPARIVFGPVTHELVSEKIEVDPFLRAAPLRAAQKRSVELSRLIEVANAYCQMKWWQTGLGQNVMSSRSRKYNGRRVVISGGEEIRTFRAICMSGCELNASPAERSQI